MYIRHRRIWQEIGLGIERENKNGASISFTHGWTLKEAPSGCSIWLSKHVTHLSSNWIKRRDWIFGSGNKCKYLNSIKSGLSYQTNLSSSVIAGVCVFEVLKSKIAFVIFLELSSTIEVRLAMVLKMILSQFPWFGIEFKPLFDSWQFCKAVGGLILWVWTFRSVLWSCSWILLLPTECWLNQRGKNMAEMFDVNQADLDSIIRFKVMDVKSNWRQQLRNWNLCCLHLN